MRRFFILGLALAGVVCTSYAQVPTPSADQMVQQLKAKPRTRSLRNLNVEAADVDAPARPSLSLLIQFDFNSARVSPQSQQALVNLSQALQSSELIHSRFVVEGHTDAKGREDYNQQLSTQRAQAVVRVLKAHGVAEERLQAAGKGATELANRDDPLAAENRRVRVVNLD
jgi:outer membrane protein OmpA-like peptidoglycan-associated protein